MSQINDFYSLITDFLAIYGFFIDFFRYMRAKREHMPMVEKRNASATNLKRKWSYL